jgi:hypothetical protein
MEQAKMEEGMQRLGWAARPLLVFSALCAFLCGVGLILPAAAGLSSWITPLVAALAALMMLFATGFHVVCRGTRSIVFGLIIFALATFLSYGRWFVAPL